MEGIRYWSETNENSSKIHETASKETKKDNFIAFQESMVLNLMDSVDFAGGASMLGNSADMFSLGTTVNALFGNLGGQSGNLEDRLKNIQDQGMSKVLAAQFANRIPDFGFQSGGNQQGRKNEPISGFNELISLSMQSQMMKARAAIERQMADRGDSQLGIVNSDADKTSVDDLSLSAFVEDMKSQIDIASNKYNLEEGELKKFL